MSGWNAMTVHPPSGLHGESRTQAEEGIQTYLNEDFDDSPYDDPAGGYAERTAQIGRFYSDTVLEDTADTVFEECPYAGRIVFVYADDTGMSGSYWYFERQDGETVLVDQWDGYEGAVGKDAAQRVEDEHGVGGYASYEA